MPVYDVVIPTVGRPSLGSLLQALAVDEGPPPQQVIVVDDRPGGAGRAGAVDVHGDVLPVPLPVRVLHSGGRGPAAARNVGWRAGGAPWVVFLDDDVVPRAGWRLALASDLSEAATAVASQGRVTVPLADRSRMTDWERNTVGLETARWATADMAYRRSTLVRVGGFDERFRWAYREDADLGLRASALGRIERGSRLVDHPVRRAPWWVSVARQAGNADDALMASLHGRDWRRRAGAPAGTRRSHALTVAAAATTITAGSAGRRLVAGLAGAAWAASTARFAHRRIAPGPRDRREVAAMVATSVLIPPTAISWWMIGRLRVALRPPAPWPCATASVEAVLFDRDGTLVEDVPYNGDPDRVALRPGARDALDRLRRAGIPIGMVSNQSGVGTGTISLEQVHAVNRRVQELVGPITAIEICPHRADAGCTCRKPQPQMILRAAEQLGTAPERCVVVGDIGSDMAAATAAGAYGVLVPTAVTRPQELAAAPHVASDLHHAVDLILTSELGLRPLTPVALLRRTPLAVPSGPWSLRSRPDGLSPGSPRVDVTTSRRASPKTAEGSR